MARRRGEEVAGPDATSRASRRSAAAPRPANTAVSTRGITSSTSCAPSSRFEPTPAPRRRRAADAASLVRLPGAPEDSLPVNPLLSSIEKFIPKTPQQRLEESQRWGRLPNTDDLEGFGYSEQAARELADLIRAQRPSDNLGEPTDITDLALLVGGGLGFRALKGAIAAARPRPRWAARARPPRPRAAPGNSRRSCKAPAKSRRPLCATP